MFGSLKCEEKQRTICKKTQFLEKIGIIVSPKSSLSINKAIATEITNILYAQFFQSPKTKRNTEDLREEIKNLFNKHNIETPITITGINNNKVLKEVLINIEGINNGLEFVAISTNSKEEIGILISENSNIIEIGINKNNVYSYINSIGTYKTLKILDSENYLMEIFNKKTYIRELVKEKNRIFLNFTVCPYDPNFVENFDEISSELNKTKFDFHKIYNCLKSYDYQNAKISKNTITIEYTEKNITQKIKISKGKLIEAEIIKDNYIFNFTEKTGWKILKKNVIFEYEIELAFKSNKYIAQIHGNTCNINNLKFGIADIIRISDYQVKKHLCDSDEKKSIYTFKNAKYKIEYETNKKWSYEYSNFNINGEPIFDNSYYIVKFNQLCYSYMIKKIISLDSLCLFESKDYKELIDEAEKILCDLN